VLKLWRALRGRRLADFKIARQAPIGPFFADFACRERRLVIEVDGATHTSDDQAAFDLSREAALIRLCDRVLRLGNFDVFPNLEGGLEAIFGALNEQAGWPATFSQAAPPLTPALSP
jgi:very-short-patch-repair endonuclease